MNASLLGMPDGVGFLGSSICSLGLCCGAGCVTLGTGCPRGLVVTPGTAGTAGNEGSWGWGWGCSRGLGGRGRGRWVRGAWG